AEPDPDVEGRGILVGRLLVVDRHLDRAEAPFLALRVHLEGDRRAARQGGGEQLGRGGSLIASAAVLRLVGDQPVLADLDVMQIAVAATGNGALHRESPLPSKSCGFGSSAERARAKARSEARLRYRRTASEARPSE